MSALIVPLCLVVYAVVLIWLAICDSRQPSRYMTADRSVGAFATMASVAGNLRDGAGLAAWVILGIYYGFGAVWLTLGLCGGLAVIALLAPGVRQLAGTCDYLTLQQLLEDKIGRRIARLSNWIIAGTALLYAAAQVNIAGTLFAQAMKAPSWIGIACTCAVVASYLFLGGYYTTIRTGVVQWCIIMVIVVVPWLVGKGQPIEIPLASVGSPGLLTGTAFFAISMAVVLSSADLWQLVFTAKSPGTARAGMLMTMPIYLAISLGLVYFAKSIEAALPAATRPEAALFDLFTSGVLPEWLAALVTLFVVAAIMSTLDSQVFLFVSTIVRELLPVGTSTRDPRMEKSSRYILLVTFVALGVIAIGIGDIVEFLFSAVTLGTVLVPAILFSAVRTNSSVSPDSHFDWGISGSVGLATLIYIGLFATGMFKALPFTLVPVFVSAMGCLAVAFFARRTRLR